MPEITEADRAQLSTIARTMAVYEKRSHLINDSDIELLLRLLVERDPEISDIVIAAAMVAEDAEK